MISGSCVVPKVRIRQTLSSQIQGALTHDTTDLTDRSIRTWDAKTLEPLLIIGGPSPNVGVQAENHLLQADIPHPNELEGHLAAVNAVALVKDLMYVVTPHRIRKAIKRKADRLCAGLLEFPPQATGH